MAQLGRIGGHLLNPTLTREGVDLAFKNTTFDATPILQLDVENGLIGIKTDAPLYELDVRTAAKTTNASVTQNAKIDNITVDATEAKFSTIQGPINIMLNGGMGTIVMERMRTDDLQFTDNVISSNNSATAVELRANGSGIVDVQSAGNFLGDLNVTGNVTVDGNLTKYSNIILGDALYNPDVPGGDTIEILPDFSQSIIPGDDDSYDFGTGNIVDSTVRRWDTMHTPDLTNVGTNRPNAVKVSNQMWLNGVTNQLFGLQSDDDFLLSPATGITHIEGFDFEASDITNMSLTEPVKMRNTGIGYLKFMGTNAFRLPGGDDSTRPSVPEIGDTRWNTDGQRLECFAGQVEAVTISGSNVSGLVDQIINSGPTLSNVYGSGFECRFTIVSGALSVEITEEGIGYNAGNTISISGAIFLGGVDGVNDVTLTVGTQTTAGYRVATGGGAEVDINLMEDLGNEYSLILG